MLCQKPPSRFFPLRANLFINSLLHPIFMSFVCVLVQIAMRFGANCNAFWCKLQCDLVLNAMRFDAKCNAKASVLTSIFCCCGCNSGTDFLQREMQKHSKWQKVEGKAHHVCCCFYHLGAFYMGFSRCFFLEWFGQKVRSVKYVYRFNSSLACRLECPIWVETGLD